MKSGFREEERGAPGISKSRNKRRTEARPRALDRGHYREFHRVSPAGSVHVV
jgi:hypothetical protein